MKWRLKRETKKWGAQRRIATAVHVSTAYVAELVTGTKGTKVGHWFAEQIAAHWGLSYDQLGAEARKEWADEQRRVERERERAADPSLTLPFREQPGWPEAVEEARRRWPTLRDEHIDAVGDYLLRGVRVDAWWIRNQARLLEEDEARTLEAADAQPAPAPALPAAREEVRTGVHPRIPSSSTPPAPVAATPERRPAKKRR